MDLAWYIVPNCPTTLDLSARSGMVESTRMIVFGMATHWTPEDEGNRRGGGEKKRRSSGESQPRLTYDAKVREHNEKG